MHFASKLGTLSKIWGVRAAHSLKLVELVSIYYPLEASNGDKNIRHAAR